MQVAGIVRGPIGEDAGDVGIERNALFVGQEQDLAEVLLDSGEHVGSEVGTTLENADKRESFVLIGRFNRVVEMGRVPVDGLGYKRGVIDAESDAQGVER